ncbi:hypothetical protein EI94DRAFT_1818689 [Lactarius quietus]|nr:hypothetical protein EI94DRAFT_1818689 [Lactarius quietus]
MLSRLSVLSVYLVASLAVSAMANPMMGQSSGHGDGTKQPSKHNYAKENSYESYPHQESSNNCNVANNNARTHETANILAILGFADVFQGNGLIGKECSPFIGKGAECKANPVCCDNVSTSGFIAIGCSHFDLGIFG